jgi:hypothetical protein
MAEQADAQDLGFCGMGFSGNADLLEFSKNLFCFWLFFVVKKRF